MVYFVQMISLLSSPTLSWLHRTRQLPWATICLLMMVSNVFTSQDLLILKNGAEQVVGEAKTGDLCGEIGVLCYRPQLFTVRTKRLSQLLRMNRATFLNIVQANVGDGNIIMNNLLQVRKAGITIHILVKRLTFV